MSTSSPQRNGAPGRRPNDAGEENRHFPRSAGNLPAIPHPVARAICPPSPIPAPNSPAASILGADLYEYEGTESEGTP